MIKNITIYIFMLFTLATMGIVEPSYADCNGKKPLCSQAISKCKPELSDKVYHNKATGSSDYVFKVNSSSQIKTSCAISASKSKCHNSYPMSGITYGSYNRVGNRQRKWGLGNHYGTDLGCHGLTNVKALAPADGVIAGTGLSTGGGRTMVIHHTKKCQLSPGERKIYSSIFRHLKKYLKKSGPVKTNDPVGIVGGSNYSAKTGLVDHPEKGSYAIHLHWEMTDSAVSASSTAVSSKVIMEPYCSSMSELCGECENTAMKDCPGEELAGTGSAGYASSGESGANGGGKEEVTCELGEYLNSDGCLFCDMFKVLFNAASIMAKTANDNLAIPSKNLVIIGFGIWLAIYLLKKMASFQAVKPDGMIKDILFQGFRVFVVVLILSGSMYEVLDLTLNPVMKTGLTFSQSLNSNSTCDKGADYMQNIMGYDGSKGYQLASTGGLSIDLGQSIMCSIKNLEDSVGFLMGLGNYSMCLSWSDAHNVFYVLPHLGYLTTGAVLWIAGVLLLIAFPWTLIDCILQLCVAAALLPCAIAAFAFKVTSKYIKVIWNFFMNAMFNIVFLSIIVYIINKMLKEQIGLNEDASNINDTIFVTATGDGLAWWGIGALKIFTTCFFFWCFIDEAKSMADRFANSAGLGGSKGIGRMVGGTLAQMGAKYAGKPALQMGKSVAGAAKESINSAVGNSFRSGINHMKGRAMVGASRMGLINTEVTLDENGNTVGYKSSFNVLGFKQTREVTRDASGVWTQNKETHQMSGVEKAFKESRDRKGNKIYVTKNGEVMTPHVDSESGNIVYSTADNQNRLVTDSDGNFVSYKVGNNDEKPAFVNGGVRVINDGFMKTRVVTDQNGNTIKEETVFNNTSSKYLVNKDGTTNMHAYEQILSGAQNKEFAATAMVDMHMKSRGMQLDKEFQNRDVKVDKEGNIIINQTNLNGSVQTIKAKMVGDQMVIENSITDTKGNTSRSLSNGIQTRNEYFQKQKDGNYKVTTKYSFNEQTNKASRITQPLSEDGTWGNNVDAQKAMAGFNAVDLENHKLQIKNRKILNQNINGEIKDAVVKSSETINFANSSNGNLPNDANNI